MGNAVYKRATEIDANNSSTALLGASEIFTGTPTCVLPWERVSFSIFSLQNGTLSVEFSNDGTTFTRVKSVTVNQDIASGHTHQFTVASPYFRLVYTNGSTAQTAFTLSTRLHRGGHPWLTTFAQEVVHHGNDVQLVRQFNDTEKDVARGLYADQESFRVFGSNAAVGTSEEDIWQQGGIRPWPTANEAFRIAAGGNANDTAAGSGAREVTIVYLDEDFKKQSTAIATAGASASASTTTSGYRVLYAYVSAAGTINGNNTGNIVIENETTGQQLATIAAGFGRTQLSHYTIPAEKIGLMTRFNFRVEANKSPIMRFWKREQADATSAPFGAKEIVFYDGAAKDTDQALLTAPVVLPAKTDLWWSGQMPSGSGDISVAYDIWLFSDDVGSVPT